MPRRGTSAQRTKATEVDINIEEKEVQPVTEVEVVAINSEENVTSKTLLVEATSLYEMIST